ncbi:expressed unknown protein [Seminavis robusta]|uniref:Uncharacterized protein n=1 Tax=Seminavis robusta TaxID=568900 RepID=A0A9N8H8R6_9STRA|nr:expressed unknown protein [Seminavis robusta]|eukprot:Sro228_g092640.1 n/a (287) ;mRNA; f:37859-38719
MMLLRAVTKLSVFASLLSVAFSSGSSGSKSGMGMMMMTSAPSVSPSPSFMPTSSSSPSFSPSEAPSGTPTASSMPSFVPSEAPTGSPTESSKPSGSPSESPSATPSVSHKPSFEPSESPTMAPTYPYSVSCGKGKKGSKKSSGKSKSEKSHSQKSRSGSRSRRLGGMMMSGKAKGMMGAMGMVGMKVECFEGFFHHNHTLNGTHFENYTTDYDNFDSYYPPSTKNGPKGQNDATGDYDLQEILEWHFDHVQVEDAEEKYHHSGAVRAISLVTSLVLFVIGTVTVSN